IRSQPPPRCSPEQHTLAILADRGLLGELNAALPIQYEQTTIADRAPGPSLRVGAYHNLAGLGRHAGLTQLQKLTAAAIVIQAQALTTAREYSGCQQRLDELAVARERNVDALCVRRARDEGANQEQESCGLTRCESGSRKKPCD
ncbi:MAG: hypothetical protein O3A63_10025, partial [Proteobacteria bacterium]|nr:hypothetical protein [Pseudomonadota bacterium]